MLLNGPIEVSYYMSKISTQIPYNINICPLSHFQTNNDIKKLKTYGYFIFSITILFN